ncbi:MAG: hypothetical protein ABIY55_14505 [Kofleriaceae bacterium]
MIPRIGATGLPRIVAMPNAGLPLPLRELIDARPARIYTSGYFTTQLENAAFSRGVFVLRA